MPPNDNQHDRQRDSVSLIIIGTFFALFSLLVLVGTFWEHRVRAIIVNIAAGLVLFLIGAGMAGFGWWMKRTNKTSSSETDR